MQVAIVGRYGREGDELLGAVSIPVGMTEEEAGLEIRKVWDAFQETGNKHSEFIDFLCKKCKKFKSKAGETYTVAVPG